MGAVCVSWAAKVHNVQCTVYYSTVQCTVHQSTVHSTLYSKVQHSKVQCRVQCSSQCTLQLATEDVFPPPTCLCHLLPVNSQTLYSTLYSYNLKHNTKVYT